MLRIAFSAGVLALVSLAGGVVDPARAAMLTNGGDFPYGGEVCAEAGGLGFAPGTEVALHGCHGYVNQQWAIELGRIFNYGQNGSAPSGLCLQATGTAEGSRVVIEQCSSTTRTQVWRVGFGESGQILNGASNLCLDGTTGAAGVQLIVNTCSSTTLSQRWEVK